MSEVEDNPQQLETVIHRGRRMTTSVQWWCEHSDMGYASLHCIHNVRLSENCTKCKEENSNG